MREEVLYVIFLDLNKAYAALDKDRCLKILGIYGVGTQDCRIFQTYWYRLWMVTKPGGYYRKQFKGFRGLTMEDPLSTTIFNVVVDVDVQHLLEERVEIAGGQGGRVKLGKTPKHHLLCG